MTDLTPKMYETIENNFKEKVNGSEKIKRFESKLKDSTATAEDVSKYALKLGDIAAEAFSDVLTEEALPNGRMYYNIAERVIKPIYKLIFKMVIDAAALQQVAENHNDGYGVKPVRPDFPEQRVDDLIWKLTSIFDEAADE